MSKALHIEPGTLIGERYVVQGELGEGGFATVYQAQHIHMRRTVAIKVLDLMLRDDDDQLGQRFTLEAETAAAIDHNNVVTVYDFGFFGEFRQPYIVMQMLEGMDLATHLEENGPMDPIRVMSLMMGCLDALGEAHHAGIIHKDIKPSNLFINLPGTRKEALIIVDFGLATVLASDVRLTSTGQLVGTPQYASPEYISAKTITTALDVYPMALTLVEMLTGRPVVDKPNPMACMMAHATGELDVPQELWDCPLGPVLRKALATDHEERFPDAWEFRNALEAIDPMQIPYTGKGKIRYTAPIRRGSDGLEVPVRRTSDGLDADVAKTIISTAYVPEDTEYSPSRRRLFLPLAVAGALALLLLFGVTATLVALNMTDEPEPAIGDRSNTAAVGTTANPDDDPPDNDQAAAAETDSPDPADPFDDGDEAPTATAKIDPEETLPDVDTTSPSIEEGDDDGDAKTPSEAAVPAPVSKKPPRKGVTRPRAGKPKTVKPKPTKSKPKETSKPRKPPSIMD